MKNKIYITGHKNPDTDSICSAIALAELKNKLGENAEAIRLGNINKETEFVLKYFNVPNPRLKASIKPQVRDIEIDAAYCVDSSLSMASAMDLIQKNNINSLPVVDDDDNLIGIVSLSNIASSYMEVWDDSIIGRSNTSFENILDVLKGKVLYLPKNPRKLSGKMAVKAIKNQDLINENDIVIVGDDVKDQEAVIKKGVSLLILTISSKLDDKLLELAKENNVAVISTGLSTFMVARILPQSVPIEYVMTKNDLVVFHKDDLIDEVREKMAQSRFRSYPVLDNKNKVIGNISRYHLISNLKKKIILVDHNERNQSIDDIDSAEIVQIVDHHRIANISTNSPIYFRNEPVGSTATIISKMFFENGIKPSREVAGLLCAAIISDTLLFRSPTSTDTDRYVLNKMKKIAAIDVDEFAMEMFKAGTSLEGRKPDELLKSDVKNFSIEGINVRVCQIFTMDLESTTSVERELKEAMEHFVETSDTDTFVLMITDIFKEISEVILVGSFKEAIARKFEKELIGDKFLSEGLLSRKKQLLPKISSAISEELS
ncbi:putative manganese-dependent inorganic diphosphatase [Peptoniphilus sp. AGMB00490]|uniref:Manganese-dependent inorganic diphosphatase n=2 Tax=Peptoniphilus TaxID=162289 RepID=A0ACD6B038_9FIRM|nr:MULTISPECIES: putative manganese-dependent inorganic diphosphatase [Peptoniphilus]NMW84807.1 putative manganese-dependent inorganic diphosphatase [Peptoniphilus faecalis]OLR65689.1 inorganic pyrophosphatase [Peptoniphilus porci]